MNDLRVTALAPFVPGGRDYEASRRLFVELGFEEVWENGGYAGFQNGGAGFILQDFRNEAFASNLMIRIEVPDLDFWWKVVSGKELAKHFPGFRITPPADFP